MSFKEEFHVFSGRISGLSRMDFVSFNEGFQCLFFQNAIEAHPHGSKNPIVLYQEMWLRRWSRGPEQ